MNRKHVLFSFIIIFKVRCVVLVLVESVWQRTSHCGLPLRVNVASIRISNINRQLRLALAETQFLKV